MPTDPLDRATVDRLLTTTRAVRRRLDLDRPVDPALVRECLRLALHAPSAENLPLARWVVVTDPELRARLGALYARGLPELRARAARATDAGTRRLYDSAAWLAEHLGRVPVHVVPCLVARPGTTFSAIGCASLYGSVLPAVWSLQLALRSRGLGSVFTTLHLACEDEARALLGIPPDALQVALVPVAHLRGAPPGAAARPPLSQVAYHDRWGNPLEETR